MKNKSSILCEHANEVPTICKCKSNCYCKSHTCKADKMIEAELWGIFICDGVIDMVHGGGREIKEIFIPNYCISFNVENGTLNAFKSNTLRYSSCKSNHKISSDFRISDKYAKSLSGLLEVKKELHEQAIEIFKVEI